MLPKDFLLPDFEEVLLEEAPIKSDIDNDFAECPFLDRGYGDDWLDTGWINNFNLDLVLSHAIERGASDIHLAGDRVVCFSVLGDIVRCNEFPIPEDDTMQELTKKILTYEAIGDFVKDLEYDTSYKIRIGRYEGRRFRVNIGKSFDTNIMTFRTIESKIPSKESLGIDSEFYELFNNSSGVVLVCGATGSGKTTSLASVIRNIQTTQRKKIITVERPIEFIYPDDGLSCVIQRDIPSDCLSFSNGLTSAMRSSPDIILIGEVRNKEEVDELLRASETGHLSVSTVHTSNNIVTLNRIRSLYEGSEQKRIMSTLGDNLRGIVNQVLVKSIDGKSRFAVREILKVDFNIRRIIQNDELYKIREKQEISGSTLEHKLIECVNKRLCTLEEARSKAPDQSYFDYLINER